MIEYNPKSWVSLIFDVYSRYVIKSLFPLLAFMIVYSTVLTYVLVDIFEIHIFFEGAIVFHSLLGVVLGLFLVLRTNTAYDRWWEGRKLWGQLVNDTRSLSMKVNAYLPEKSRDDRSYFEHMIPNFVYAMKEHLRHGTKMEELEFENEEEEQKVKACDHKPNKINSMLFQRIDAIFKKGEITGEQLIIFDKEIKNFADIMGACERIKTTPIPYSYSMYIKKFLFIYTMTLPLAFVVEFGYWTVILVALIFYILVSIELIAEEIEDPFGKDINDLPVERISMNIKRNVKEIIQVDFPKK
ncbi:bestrophin family ion channel [uncultured Imperialibacter sp.]|uniref:bestrophin family protein n=1 Tax=uncultured Imperialibacter sp. TaxID=1672639 RepID=UPI0030DB8584|tara:strand:+ start:757 stop:1650 length:894 start_codon:yes stop_codon:yes gene_type:complete